MLLFLALACLLFFAPRMELALGPTATPTATGAPAATATPDFGATRVAQDMATQAAGPLVNIVTATPTAASVAANELDIGQGSEAEVGMITGIVTVTVIVTVIVPVGDAGTAEPMAVSPLDSPLDPQTETINLPIAPSGATAVANSVVPTPIPTLAPVPADTATLPPPSVTPSPSPVSTLPTMTPTPYLVDYLLASVDEENILRRRAPITGADVEDNGTWQTAEEISLLGRSPSGEWVFGEQNSDVGWLRQHYIRFLDNKFVGDPPEGVDDADADDVRWLPIQPWPGDVNQPPAATPIPSHDYPLVRRNHANQGRVENLPETPYAIIKTYETQDSFKSPVVTAGDLVVAVNDDQHVYGISGENVSQEMKQKLDSRPMPALAIQDSTVYAADERGVVYALSRSDRLWQRETGMTQIGGLSVAGDRLLVTGRVGEGPRLAMIRRSDGEVIDTFTATGEDFSLPAIGDQLIYVVGSRVWALDLYHERDNPDNGEGTESWQAAWITSDDLDWDPSSPPVYLSPGITSLAELYIGATDGETYLLDANTGKQLELYEGERPVQQLAIDGTRLYTTGKADDAAFLNAYDLESRDRLWEIGLSDVGVSGPIVDGAAIVMFQQDGVIEVFNADNGARLGSQPVASELWGGVVSGEKLFATGTGNQIYVLKGQD